MEKILNNKFGMKKILGNSLWPIIEKIITMVITVVASSLIARYLGTEEYGLANYIISLVMLFTAFSTLGMEKITINDIVNEEYEKETVLATSFLIRAIGGIVLTIFSQIAIYILTDGDKISSLMGIIMGASMIFKSFEVFEYYLQAVMNLKTVAIIRFLSTVLTALSRILVVFLDLGMISFISTYIIEALIAGILFYIYYRSKNKGKFKVDKKYAINILSRCWYIAVAGLMTTLYMRIDQIMLGSMLETKFENGIYSAAVRIAEMWYFVPLSVITSFQPIIIKYKAEKNEEQYKKSMQRLYDIVAIIGIACGVLITIFSGLAVDILYGAEYKKAASVLCISVWAGLFATLGSARSIWLIVENKQKYTMVYSIVGSVLNIILNLIMIPKIGAFGAATATLLTQFIANVFALMIFKETRESSIMILKSLFKNKTIIEVINKIIKK